MKNSITAEIEVTEVLRRSLIDLARFLPLVAGYGTMIGGLLWFAFATSGALAVAHASQQFAG
jgi:hypothetical protein